MSLILVTQQCYLVCDKITYITLEQQHATDSDGNYLYTEAREPTFIEKLFRLKNGARRHKMVWVVTIDYTPESFQNGNSNRNSRESCTVSIDVFEKEDAVALFKEMVSQIRDQCPDQLYLDKLISNTLGGDANAD